MSNEYIIVMTTTDTKEKARDLARALIESKLAACVEFHVTDSIYPWKGRICDTPEYVLHIKTPAALYMAVEQKIKSLHTYELPQIIAVPIIAGLGEYLEWLRAETTV